MFDGGQHGGHANIEHVDHEQLEIVGEREANLLTRSTCNLGQQKHGVANVHGTHMEAPSMGVGMVTHEDPVVEEALPAMGGNVEMEDVNQTTSYEIMDELGKAPLYEGSTLSSLALTLLKMNCCKTHGTTNAFVNELLGLLKQSVLPQPNTLLAIEHEVTTILNKLGLA